jgi:hypothetical protein
VRTRLINALQDLAEAGHHVTLPPVVERPCELCDSDRMYDGELAVEVPQVKQPARLPVLVCAECGAIHVEVV